MSITVDLIVQGTGPTLEEAALDLKNQVELVTPDQALCHAYSVYNPHGFTLKTTVRRTFHFPEEQD